jgi:hypothetical protein
MVMVIGLQSTGNEDGREDSGREVWVSRLKCQSRVKGGQEVQV